MDFNKIKETYLATFKKYVEFSGRAGREEFWTFFFVNFAISIILSWLDTFISNTSFTGTGFLGGIFSLAILLPGLAVAVRRLHDINKSGGWIFIALIPFIGWIILLIFAIKEGDAGSNEYGPNVMGKLNPDPQRPPQPQEPKAPQNPNQPMN